MSEPRDNPAPANTAPALGEPEAGDPARSRDRKSFVWPPAPSQSPDSPASTSDVVSASELTSRFARELAYSKSRGRLIADECEDHWLDLTHPSLARRAHQQDWTPDLPGSYCPRCGVTAGPRGADLLGCPSCTGVRPAFERIVRLGAFEDLLRDAVHELKFDQQRAIGRRLGRLLGAALAHELSRAGVDRGRLVLVPMPTTVVRRLHRGIDHTLVLARAMRPVTGGVIARPIYKRHRPSQVEVNPSERERNMARAFRPWWKPLRPLMGGPELSGKVVVVIDDVTTSGATLRGACRAVMAAWRAGTGQSGGGRREKALGTTLERPRVWAAVLGVTPGEPEAVREMAESAPSQRISESQKA